jgi:hypothetical protein
MQIFDADKATAVGFNMSSIRTNEIPPKPSPSVRQRVNNDWLSDRECSHMTSVFHLVITKVFSNNAD